ncbi:hypothetical protein D3C73_1429260 [compost metagenome]|jgi:hypothetical protein
MLFLTCDQYVFIHQWRTAMLAKLRFSTICEKGDGRLMKAKAASESRRYKNLPIIPSLTRGHSKHQMA